MQQPTLRWPYTVNGWKKIIQPSILLCVQRIHLYPINFTIVKKSTSISTGKCSSSFWGSDFPWVEDKSILGPRVGQICRQRVLYIYIYMNMICKRFPNFNFLWLYWKRSMGNIYGTSNLFSTESYLPSPSLLSNLPITKVHHRTIWLSPKMYMCIQHANQLCLFDKECVHFVVIDSISRAVML